VAEYASLPICRQACQAPDNQLNTLDVSGCQHDCYPDDPECDCTLRCFGKRIGGGPEGSYNCYSLPAEQRLIDHAYNDPRFSAWGYPDANFEDNAWMIPQCIAPIWVQIVDARTQGPLGGVTIAMWEDESRLRKVQETTTDNAEGKANCFTSDPFIYLTATKDGYSALSWTIDRITMCSDPKNCGTQRAMSPKLSGGDIGDECHFWVDPGSPNIGMRAVLEWLETPLDLDIWVRNYDCFESVAARYGCATGSTKNEGCRREEFSSEAVQNQEYLACGVSKPRLMGPNGNEVSEMTGGVTMLDSGLPILKGSFANQFSKWVTWVSRQCGTMQRKDPLDTTPSPWTTHNHIVLDVDKRSGYGPETVSFINPPPGIYQIVVDKYSANSATSLKGGQPTVQLYFGANGVGFECKIDPQCPHDSRVWNVANIQITEDGVLGDRKKYKIRILDHAEDMKVLRRVELPTTERKMSRGCGPWCSEAYFQTASSIEYDDGYLQNVCYGTCKRMQTTPEAFDSCLKVPTTSPTTSPTRPTEAPTTSPTVALIPFEQMTASQSSTGRGGWAWNPLTVNIQNGQWNHWPGTCSHTTDLHGGEPQPWWQVQLDSAWHVEYIQLTQRFDCCNDRLQNIDIFVGAAMCATGVSIPQKAVDHTVPCVATGSDIKIQHRGRNTLTLCGFKAYGTKAPSTLR
jgi:hypothetical protein